jgi:hypothetical protein
VTCYSLTSSNRLSATTFGSSVRLSSLSTNWEATTVSQSPESLNIRESADVQLSLSSKVTLDEESCPLDSASYASQFFVIEIPNAGCFCHARFFHDLLRCGSTDAINGSQCYFESLVIRDVYTGDDCHKADFSCLLG